MELTKEQREVFLTNESDHEGHAVCTIALYPEKFKYCDTHGWLVHSKTHWETEGARQAAERAVTNTLQQRRSLFAELEMMGKAKQCMSWRNNVTGTLAQMAKASSVFTAISKFDESKDELNVKNGVLNLKTGKLTPHTGKQLFTYCLSISYKPDTKQGGEWNDFLKSVGLSSNLIEFLRLAVGYSLTGHTREEILFYLYGPTRSGKGTFTEVLNTILGQLSTGVDMQTFTAKRYGDTSNFDLAPLKNKRFITASESQRYGQINPAMIKKVTGGDEIYCSFKRRDHFSYRPQFKIWLTSNFQVNTDIDDDAAWGRLRVIHFSESFLGKEDKTLKDRLKRKASLEAILAWAVSGAMDWYKMTTVGLPMPAEVEEQTKAHRAALDSISQFLDQNCIIDTVKLNQAGKLGSFTIGKRLYSAYRTWCDEEGYKQFGRRRFTTSLTSKNVLSEVRRIDGQPARGYAGVRFIEDDDPGFSDNGQYKQADFIDEIPGFD
jgi:putative DNA primase/helicase